MTTTEPVSSATSLPKLQREGVAKLLQDGEPRALTLFLILHQISGEDFFMKDPLVLYAELEEFTGIERVSEDIESRIQALITLLTTDAFYDDPIAFRAICNTLSTGEPGFDDADPVTVDEMLWAIYEAGFFDDSPPEFSAAVSREIARILQAEDVFSAEEAQAEQEVRKLALKVQLEGLGFEMPALG